MHEYTLSAFLIDARNCAPKRSDLAEYFKCLYRASAWFNSKKREPSRLSLLAWPTHDSFDRPWRHRFVPWHVTSGLMYQDFFQLYSSVETTVQDGEAFMWVMEIEIVHQSPLVPRKDVQEGSSSKLQHSATKPRNKTSKGIWVHKMGG